MRAHRDRRLGALPAEVGLRRRDARRGRVRRHRGGGARARLPARLGEQRADRALGLVVVALPVVPVAHLPARVDQVLRRPVLVLPRVPGAVVVVEPDRVAQAVLRDRVAHVGLAPLERELGRVDADDRQARGPVAAVPRTQVRERAQAVDAGVGPEVDQDHPAAQPAHARLLTGRGVEPARDAGELRRRPAVLEQRVAVAPRDVARARLAPVHPRQRAFHRAGLLQAGGGIDERGREVVRDRGLEVAIQSRGEQHGDGDHQHPERLLQPPRVGADPARERAPERASPPAARSRRRRRRRSRARAAPRRPRRRAPPRRRGSDPRRARRRGRATPRARGRSGSRRRRRSPLRAAPGGSAAPRPPRPAGARRARRRTPRAPRSPSRGRGLRAGRARRARA